MKVQNQWIIRFLREERMWPQKYDIAVFLKRFFKK